MIGFSHHFVHGFPLPDNGYLCASNGVFLRACREGLNFTLPIARAMISIKGLQPIQSSLQLSAGKLSTPQMVAIDHYFRRCYPNEAIAWIDGAGELIFPDLVESTPSSCRPKPSDLYPKILVEIHSHGRYSPHFSQTDDIEQTGFRLYGIFSYATRACVVHFRLGYHQQFWSVPARVISELPQNFQDFKD